MIIVVPKEKNTHPSEIITWQFISNCISNNNDNYDYDDDKNNNLDNTR